MREPFELVIERPADFWHVTFADGFVQEAPDIADGKTRTYLEGDADWIRVSAALKDISRQLKSAPQDRVAVTVSGLESEADEVVIRSWFDRWQPVIGDPGYLEDGRRRLWKALGSQPGATVPVRSEVRSQLARKTGPTQRQVDNILAGVDEDIWILNQHLRPWFESRRR